jgi:hypothetical protein
LKANVEQIFSRAGELTDPNIDQDYLATLVVVLVGCNKKAFKPSAVMPLRPGNTSSFVAREGRDSRRTARR